MSASIIAAYARIAAVSYPDYYKSCLDCYPHDKARGLRAAAEIAYILEHDALPEWATAVESYEVINGGFLFIHCDPDATTN